MNKSFFYRYFMALFGIAVALVMVLAISLPLQAQTDSKGEEFFIVSSVDQKNHQLVLMHPTQLTVAAVVSPQTVCISEDGKKMSTSALRAGDTVWAILKTGKNGVTKLVSIREGAMTQAELQKLYLHYSTPTPSTPPTIPLKPSPLNPPPQSGAAQPPATVPAVNGSNAMLRGQHRPGEPHRHPHGPGGPADSNR